VKHSAATLAVGIIGCGLIGKRRCEEATRNSRSRVVCVSDARSETAAAVARDVGAVAVANWRDIVDRDDVDVVIVATPNAFLMPIATAAFGSGKHVLLEKPMGRNLAEAQSIAAAAKSADRLVKVGFNHRYHPALAAAHAELGAGDMGAAINIRAVYGHGGRPGYENEWRGSLELAGGGEATDQGVHIFDLLHWFAGVPSEVFSYVQSAVWPISPLEDNAFGLVRFPSSVVASFHTSWTQWKNRFALEIFCERGSLIVDGLGKSYGPERLVLTHRKHTGGVPDVVEQRFDDHDTSWAKEWDEFVAAVLDGRPYMGGATDGLVAMQILDAVYRSATTGRIVELGPAEDPLSQ
jgi:predicted dehydrogenase